MGNSYNMKKNIRKERKWFFIFILTEDYILVYVINISTD